MTKIIVMGQEYTKISSKEENGSYIPYKTREVSIKEFEEVHNSNSLIMLGEDGKRGFRYSRKELEENGWIELDSFERPEA